jgi:GDP-4-dehydro-6-deoxy-D-mannose reductase
MQLRGSRVLVTGVGGFVGEHLARALTAAGADVWGTGIEPDSTPAVATQGAVNAYRAGVDLTHADAAADLVAWARPDAIVHLAGQSSAARSFEIPEETFAANALGTWNLLHGIGRAAPRARTLIVGTSEVYGPQPDGTRVDESAPFRPVSPYALSKAAADAFAEVFARQREIDVIRTRSFGHAGPGQTPRFVVPAFAKQIAEIEAGKAEPILRVGNLDVTRDLLDVRDVTRAYVLLLERGASGAAYNVCRGEGVKLTEVARMLCERAKTRVRIEIDAARMRPADVPYLVGDPTAIERATGWSASIPLEKTLDDVLEEWRGFGRSR